MQDSPRSLEQWLAALETLPLPLGTELRAAALTAIDKGCSAAALADRLLDDPAAVLLIFREANRALAKYEREAHGLEHAISLLGMARVQKLLRDAPTLSVEHPFTREYRQAQQRSQHAAWQARLWAEGTGRWPADEMFWDTLLAGAPHWLLWLEAGTLRLQLSKLRAQRGFVTPAESAALFGCDLNELMRKLTETWCLPRTSQRAWQMETLGSRREWIALARAARLDTPPDLPAGRLTELSQQASLLVALANLLAVEADWDWDGRHYTRLLRIAATCCRRPVATVSNFVHQTAAGFSRMYRGDLQTPAARLLCHWRQAHVWAPPPEPQPEPIAPPPAATAPTEPPKADPRQFAIAVRQLQQAGGAANVRTALTLALQALHGGLGFRHVAALLLKPSPPELQTLLGRGLESTPALRQLRLPLTAGSLLDQLLRKPVCLRLDAGSKYLPLLPGALRQVVSEQLLLCSLVVDGAPFGLLVADNGGTPIDDTLHQRARQLAGALGQALAQIGKP